MLVEVASTGGDLRRVLDHHAEKRTRKGFNQRLLIDGPAVPGGAELSMRENMPHAFISMLI